MGDIATMDERIAESLASDRTNMLLMGIFAALGLLQAAIGILSVIPVCGEPAFARDRHPDGVGGATGVTP